MRQLHLQVHKVWQEIHGLQTELTKLFTKQSKIQEATELKQMQMAENKRQIETLEAKMKEIQQKEQLAEQRLEEQLSNIEEKVEAASESVRDRYDEVVQYTLSLDYIFVTCFAVFFVLSFTGRRFIPSYRKV